MLCGKQRKKREGKKNEGEQEGKERRKKGGELRLCCCEETWALFVLSFRGIRAMVAGWRRGKKWPVWQQKQEAECFHLEPQAEHTGNGAGL